REPGRRAAQSRIRDAVPGFTTSPASRRPRLHDVPAARPCGWPRVRDRVRAAVWTAGATVARRIRFDHPDTDRAPTARPSGPRTGLAAHTIPGPDSSRS